MAVFPNERYSELNLVFKMLQRNKKEFEWQNSLRFYLETILTLFIVAGGQMKALVSLIILSITQNLRFKLVEIDGAGSKGKCGKVLPPCSCLNFEDGGDVVCKCDNGLRPVIEKKAFPKKGRYILILSIKRFLQKLNADWLKLIKHMI